MLGRDKHHGFTIIELLVVIAIIGILATIVIVSYSGITNKAHDASLQSDVDNASTLLDVYRAENHKYPQDSKDANSGNELPSSGGNVISYNVSTDSKRYCVAASRDGVSYRKSSQTDKIESGDCSTVSLMIPIQTITSANCPTDRMAVVDTRDSHTYWVQKLADGKCWMLTNLAYAGGGSDRYSDTKPLTNGTNDGTDFYNQAKYYVSPGSNVTTEPDTPSESTDGIGQYGYLYNWCAAMGAQIGTSACNNTSADNWNHAVSICPAGWRLPVGHVGEFGALNDAVNNGLVDSNDGLLLTWLVQYGGVWGSGLYGQDSWGSYWSSTQYSATSSYVLDVYNPGTDPDNDNSKGSGFAVRCLANS